MTIIIGKFGHSSGGPLVWSHYQDTGGDELVCLDRGDQLTLTVNFYNPPQPETPQDHVWLKVWGGFVGVERALIEAGVIEATPSSTWPAGYATTPCYKLTALAVADRDAHLARHPDQARHRAASRAAYAASRTRQGIG